MAGTSVEYSVMVKDLRKRVLPALDDEFAKDVGEFETLQALRDRVSCRTCSARRRPKPTEIFAAI